MTRGKRGPKPDHLKIDETWEEALKKAVKRKRPSKWSKVRKKKRDTESPENEENKKE